MSKSRKKRVPARAARTTAGVAVVLFCAFLGMSGAFECGLKLPPPQYAVPSPDGGIAYTCPSAAHPSASSTPARPPADSPVAVTEQLENWPGRTDCFANAKGIVARTVHAGDVVSAPTSKQHQLLTTTEANNDRLLVPLGGDYWRNTEYPIAPEGVGPWVSSGFRTDTERTAARTSDHATGILSSKTFKIATKYLHMSIGGNQDAGLGVELLVRTDGRKLSCRVAPVSRGWPEIPPGMVRVAIRRRHAPETDSDSDAYPDLDSLQRTTVKLDEPSCDLRGLDAVLRIIDGSLEGHINVGAVELSDSDADEKEPRPLVWGFADFHSHPTDYLAFGGLQGLHAVWGAPGGSMSEYVGSAAHARRNFARDIPPCDDPHLAFNAHHGGFAAPEMINGAEGRLTASLKDLRVPQVAFKHDSQGAPTYENFPSFRSGAHEQYHISQIHRAYLGGLRLMTALAVNNPGLEYGMGWVTCKEGSPTVDTTGDWQIVRAHVEAMRQLEQLNADWMQIAYTPAQARSIIAHNKLAVVLGVEVPRLGMDGDGSPEEQVNALDALGVRQVVLVHGMDNSLGGSALFQDLYNTVTDWMNRKPGDRDKVETLSGAAAFWSQFPAAFFSIRTDGSRPVDSSPDGAPVEPTERILYRLGNPERIVLSDVFPSPGPYTYEIPGVDLPFGPLHTLVNTTPIFRTVEGEYDEFTGGHRNKRGLTGRGREFIQRLMMHGMLFDLAHMSDETLHDAYNVENATCDRYPLMVSHAHYRALPVRVDYSDRAADFVSVTQDAVLAKVTANPNAMVECVRNHGACDPFVLQEALRAQREAPELGPGTVDRGSLPREFDIASSEVQQIRARDGGIGVFIGQGAFEPNAFAPGTLPFALDCAGSSKSTAAALIYGVQHMRDSGGNDHGALGIATDFTLVGNTVPRFGLYACANYLGAGASSASGAQLLETLLEPDQYKFDAQTDAVVYSSVPGAQSKGWLPYGHNVPLEPYVMGDRIYDFNVDGLAHYGLVPDLFQDMANVMKDKTGPTLEKVFQSAGAYIDMWQRARDLSNCEETGRCVKEGYSPREAECDAPLPAGVRLACGNSCPCAWNRGAPLQEVAQGDAVCDPGQEIRFLAVDQLGNSGKLDPIYTQRRADPLTAAPGIKQQGDWAVYPIRTGQLWTCGGGGPQVLGCPEAANYVKVRRILDTTVSVAGDSCDKQPLPPVAGDRRVLFQCLVGPPFIESPRVRALSDEGGRP